MFYSFASQDDRRKYGGSGFIEIQYCILELGVSLKNLVDVNLIDNWKNDSLYIYCDDIDTFYCEYKSIFYHGLYNNGQFGVVDVYGINYYSQEEVLKIKNILLCKKPVEYKKLLEWLDSKLHYNGIYILGI